MQLLYTFDLKNYDPSWSVSPRPSARAIILTDYGKIALVHSKKFNYYKFPGGGIDEGESNETALIREVREEAGLTVIPSSIKEYGVFRRLQKSTYLKDTIFLQESFYYTCQVEKEIKSQQLDDYEAEEGFELKIVDIETAIKANREYDDGKGISMNMLARENLILERLLGVESYPPVPAAERLLEMGVAQNPGPWREHSYAVANAAKKIAVQMQKNGCNIDPEKAYIYGLLHDIGRREGVTYMRHVIDGYHYFHEMGYPKVAQICLTHSFNLHIIDDYIGKIDVTDEEYEEIKSLLAACEYDDYDRLIQVLDSTCGADGTVDLEARMSDVKRRYGEYPEGKWNKNFELKDYFEKKMGKGFYEVIKG